MKIKWNGLISTIRNLPGGGPQGSTTGLLEYKSQTNNNCDFVPADMRYKWVDDLSILEMINLLSVGLSSYNFKQHVASDIGINQNYLSNENIQSQNYASNISKWTKDNKMKLNVKKTKVMIINFTKNYQLTYWQIKLSLSLASYRSYMALLTISYSHPTVHLVKI